jgi:hypothetical protein
MDAFTLTLPQTRSTRPLLQFPLRARPRSRDLPTVCGARALNLHYQLSYSEPSAADSLEALGNDATLVIDAVYEYHQNRQAMLGALALLRGDDLSEQVW